MAVERRGDLRDRPRRGVLHANPRAGGKSVRAEVRTIRRRAEVVEVDWELVRAAAEIKAGGGLSYADAFCVATAKRLKAELWTGDPEIIGRADQLSCEVRDLRE